MFGMGGRGLGHLQAANILIDKQISNGQQKRPVKTGALMRMIPGSSRLGLVSSSCLNLLLPNIYSRTLALQIR